MSVALPLSTELTTSLTAEIEWEIPLRLLVALVLTGFIGLEREQGHKPAGLRTHMLVGLGSACFTLGTLGLYAAYWEQGAREYPYDPVRLVQGLIGGIGFLGAGSIIRRDDTVQGLTTAGTIWLSGAIGMSAGLGQYMLAASTVLLALAVLRGLSAVERRWFDSPAPHRSENPAQNLTGDATERTPPT